MDDLSEQEGGGQGAFLHGRGGLVRKRCEIRNQKLNPFPRWSSRSRLNPLFLKASSLQKMEERVQASAVRPNVSNPNMVEGICFILLNFLQVALLQAGVALLPCC